MLHRPPAHRIAPRPACILEDDQRIGRPESNVVPCKWGSHAPWMAHVVAPCIGRLLESQELVFVPVAVHRVEVQEVVLCQVWCGGAS